MVSLASLVGDAVRAVGSSKLARRGGTAAYLAAASAAARGLSRLPGVRSVYLMGAIGRGELVDPGFSDIDLVVAGDFPSPERELETMTRLAEWQDRMSVFGGLVKCRSRARSEARGKCGSRSKGRRR